jgi:aspartyl-tRNA(Asn)/glutamyl-tRNA(Gln) amidotransferase subunit C
MAKPTIDEATVQRIARLARIKISSDEAHSLQRELNGILAWVEELNSIRTGDVAPLTSMAAAHLKMRADVVTDGNSAADILKNAPKAEDGFFLVPKVIE